MVELILRDTVKKGMYEEFLFYFLLFIFLIVYFYFLLLFHTLHTFVHMYGIQAHMHTSHAFFSLNESP